MRIVDENIAIWVLIVSVAIFMILIGFEHAREEKAAIREGRVSAKHIERIKGKVRFFSALNNGTFQAAANGFVYTWLVVPLFLGIPVIWMVLFYPKMEAVARIGLLSPAVVIVALMLLWDRIPYFLSYKLHRLKNDLWFFENLYAAQRNGSDLNVMRPLLEHELQRLNESARGHARREFASRWDGAPWRSSTHQNDEQAGNPEMERLHARTASIQKYRQEVLEKRDQGLDQQKSTAQQATAQADPEQKEETGRNTLMRTAEDVVASEEAAIEQLESYEGELKELAQEEIKMRRDAIRHAQEGDPEMARLLVGAANFQKTKREVLEKRNRRIQAKQEQLSAQQAAQAEPKQTGEDSIRALLGARIKEMEAILERLQAERERLANVASAEELDALATEIRARQKLIHAINQGADDMELHLCVQRVQLHEENRKEFEQMRLSGA